LTQATTVRLLPTRRESRRLGAALARVLVPGDLAAFSGDLGAGKTFVVRAAARALGVSGAVTSPTFTIVREYVSARGVPVLHADLYRLRRTGHELDAEVARLGLRERRSEGAIVLVEWGDDAMAALGGDPAVAVHLAFLGPTSRVASIAGPRAAALTSEAAWCA
jgi:tRNA threonylcarbamoyladenosine biosynthesis protein TsaE